MRRMNQSSYNARAGASRERRLSRASNIEIRIGEFRGQAPTARICPRLCEPLFEWSRMSGRRTSGSSRPSLGVQIHAVLAFEHCSARNVWEGTWKSQTSIFQTPTSFGSVEGYRGRNISKTLFPQWCSSQRVAYTVALWKPTALAPLLLTRERRLHASLLLRVLDGRAESLVKMQYQIVDPQSLPMTPAPNLYMQYRTHTHPSTKESCTEANTLPAKLFLQ